MSRAISVLVAVVALLVAAAPSQATYPGDPQGKIAFSARIGADTSNEISVYDLAAQQLDKLTEAPGDDIEPSWNPDGSRLVFASEREDAATTDCAVDRCDFELYTVDVDGSDEVPLTNTPTRYEWQPAWSPDGARIAYTSVDEDNLPFGLLRVMDADGTNDSLLFGSEGAAETQATDPTWSPRGDRLAYDDRFAGIWVGNSDGTGKHWIGNGSEPNWSPYHDLVLAAGGTQFSLKALPADDLLPVDIPGPQGQRFPVWSPDMDRIAVLDGGTTIDLVRPDGSDRTPLIGTEDAVSGLDWLATPTNVPGYVRPKHASPIRVPLVPAYRECTAPDSQHGPPLAFGSCNPPVQQTSLVTVGTPDANGREARSVGSVTIATVAGNPSTHEDEADVVLRFDISDVRRTGNLADYSGNLVIPLDLRITDRNNGCCPVGGPYAATGINTFDIEFGGHCFPTADPDEGARCTGSTSVDALNPGTIGEGNRSTWEIGRIEVFVQEPGQPGPFAVQGLFVP